MPNGGGRGGPSTCDHQIKIFGFSIKILSFSMKIFSWVYESSFNLINIIFEEIIGKSYSNIMSYASSIVNIDFVINIDINLAKLN